MIINIDMKCEPLLSMVFINGLIMHCYNLWNVITSSPFIKDALASPLQKEVIKEALKHISFWENLTSSDCGHWDFRFSVQRDQACSVSTCCWQNSTIPSGIWIPGAEFWPGTTLDQSWTTAYQLSPLLLEDGALFLAGKDELWAFFMTIASKHQSMYFLRNA